MTSNQVGGSESPVTPLKLPPQSSHRQQSKLVWWQRQALRSRRANCGTGLAWSC